MKVYVVKFQCNNDVIIEKVFGNYNDAIAYVHNKFYEEFLEIIEMELD